MNKTAMILGLAFCLLGCMSVGTKVEQNQLSSFEKGKTTYAEVITALGTPQAVTSQSDGRNLISYTFSQASADAASFIPLIGGLVGTTQGELVVVTLLFDSTGKLESFTHTESKSSYGLGGPKNIRIETSEGN